MPPVVSMSTISREADRVAILVNPKAGPIAAQPGADRLAGLLEKRGFKIEVFTDLVAATTQANRWHAEGRLRTLVGVGGDGTAAELANRTHEGVPLTLFPGGNSNLLAVYYQMTKDPEQVCRVISDGVAARIDAGRANGRIFLIMIGCGFDAEVVNRVHANRTGHISLKNYLGPVAQTVRSYEYPELHAHWDDGQPATSLECGGQSPHSKDGPGCSGGASLSARWLFVFNLPCYGGGFRIAPYADGSDGLLDLCAFRRGGFWKCMTSVVLRRHQRSADWSTRPVRRLRITSEAIVPYQLDGDPGGWLPLDVEVLPARLTLLVPKEAVSGESATSAKRE
jgi:diacylglycerol kinase (ATP)